MSEQILPLVVDSHEPVLDIMPLLEQSINATVGNLNDMGYADYLWNAVDGHSIQAERKRGGELLGNMERVEDQLKRQYEAAVESLLIIENFIIPCPTGCRVLHPVKGVFLRSRDFRVSYAGFLSWLYQLDKLGITTYFTPDLVGTAILLVALYNNSQKEEHTTLQRYIKPKIFLEKENPHVRTLMGIEGANLGEVRAKALVKKFKTVWNILNQSEASLCTVEGIGAVTARRLLWAVGKADSMRTK